MMDHNVLRDEVSSAKRYRKLQELRMTIMGLKRGLPLSISAELEGRVTEKLRTFDYLMCSSASIKVIFSNGLSKPLDPNECHYAMSRGMKLSDYIFSKYVSARDFEIESSNSLGSTNLGVYSDTVVKEPPAEKASGPLSPDELRERIEFLMNRMESLERLETIFAENIPKMARDVNDLKDKLDSLIHKLLEKM